ncbi:unnamed protein product [Rotaria magnacalcarata]|nr:unnamed protein product [Rotaria magnacalcarata]CAF4376866.1 unnamed protein product [Rotaria magnacalcarata]
MSTIKKFSSEKGKSMLGYEGYIYTLERKTDVKMIFRCQNRDCKGRCHTSPSMDTVLSEPTEHCHGPNLGKIPVLELKNKIKSRAADSEEQSSTILHSVLRSFPLDSAGQLPKTDTLLRTIRRQRQAISVNADNRLPDHLKQTDRGENFVLHEDNKMIIFTTTSNLSILEACKHWFADGTFRVCPKDFYQMFTLHGLFKSQVIPLVYGLLIGKSTSDYDQFFERIMEEGNFNPDSILTDFEAATIKSVKSLFPNVLHKGCLFHFGQCIWRHLQSLGLQKKYQEDKYFHWNVRKLLALAFVPVVDVIKAFEFIADAFNDDDDEDFIDYFEKTWIGEPKKRGAGRKTPLFTIDLWNVYDRVSANLPRSNNSIEGWHNAFAKRVSIAHPTITKLTDKIRREQSKFEVDIAQIRQGQEPKPKKATYRKLDDRIKRLVDDYHNVHLVDYMNGLAANVSL